jgi:cell division protein FtsB
MTTRVEMPAVPVRRRAETAWIQRLMIFLALVVAADSLFGERGLASHGRLQRDVAQVRHDVSTIRNENAGLREQIRRLESDPGAIESVARGELGLIRPGEVLFVISGQR